MPAPVLAVTLGDPSGIGAEVAAKALAADKVPSVVFGDRTLFEEAWARFGQGPAPEVADAGRLAAADRRPGSPTDAGQLASARWVEAAVAAVQAGRAAALVTAPLRKRALQLAGHDVPGHTELLKKLTGAPRVAMMLAGPRLRVVLATTHCALGDVPARLRTVDLVGLLELVDAELRDRFGIAAPRLALAALNPHGGEGGLFGDEEQTLLAPAVEEARRRGVPVTGPHPADTLFARASRGELDAVLALYHDQALIPVKLLHFGEAVNVTLGLPFVRTSPDHGVAYDLAGRGTADAGSMRAAVRMAAELAARR